eukprot:CAMPEP_0185027564 /NCGR_PEP_ID=MMETSP1103-20130426/12820_1 /TAXON_ID=36769 /ORGANISM="Paraphysomonas bandaiensis, Strain Caron Lab Isolate" /LENGTH=966 /DNA_ID=CAMNT_0027561641 /DNA_START=399 /DNA_END=3296 /DNA_ORIENTATION=-
MTIRVSNGIECDVLSERQGCIINDAKSDIRCNTAFYENLGVHVTSLICVPVVLCDKVLGTLLAVNKLSPDSHFTQFELYCLSNVACNVAVALGQREPSSSSGESSIPSPPPLTSLESEMEAAIGVLVDEAYCALQADKISLFVYRGCSNLVCTVSPDIKGMELPVDAGIVGITFRSRTAINTANAREDVRHYAAVDKTSNYETGSLLSFPVVGRNGNALGVLQAVNKKDSTQFTAEDELYMSGLCVRVGEMMERVYEARNEKSCRRVVRLLGDFAACTTARTHDGNYLAQLLDESKLYAKNISNCDGVYFYSIAQSKAQSTTANDGSSDTAELVLQMLHPDEPNSPQSTATRVSDDDRFHRKSVSDIPAAVLEALREGRVKEVPLSNERGDTFLPGLDAATAVVVPLGLSSSIPLAPQFKLPIDVAIAVRRSSSHRSDDTCDESIARAEVKVLPFSKLEVHGLSSMGRILANALHMYAKFKEQEHLRTILHNNGMLMRATLNQMGTVFFVVSSGGQVLIYSRSLLRLFGCTEADMKQPLDVVLSDRSPAFMADMKECLRSNSSLERKGVKIFTTAFPQGVMVDYEMVEDTSDYRFGKKQTSSVHGLPMPSSGVRPRCIRVCVRVLGETEVFAGEDSGDVCSSISRPNSFVLAESSSSRDLSRVPSRKPSAKSGELIRSPRSFNASDAAELELLCTYEFNVLKIRSHEVLRHAVITLFDKTVNVPELNISRNQLYAYIAEIDKNYRNNPFHNFYHAVCVTHFIFMLMKETSAKSHLNSELMEFCMLLSAVAHDVDHPGNTNLFEINSGSELALRYNDTGVLENHHCATAFRLMQLPGLDIFGQLSFAQKAFARKTIISCILATDMALHVGLVEEMAARTGREWIIDTPTEKLFYGKILLHCADLSNPVRPFYLSKEWASRVSEEFNSQGEIEKANGLPLSTFLLTPDTKTLAKNEIYFSGQVVAPMW